MICKYMLPKNETQKWMRESLIRGPSLKISAMVDSSWEWERTYFFTFGYKKLQYSNLLNFNNGGIVGNADEWILKYVKNKYKNQNNQFLVEDWIMTKDAKYLTELTKIGISFLSNDNDIYYFIDINDNLSMEIFSSAFRNFPAGFHAYIVPQCRDIFSGMEITENKLLKISRDVKEIICGAYDGEGYVVANIED